MVAEITIFGPNFGESILVDNGNNHWMLIDSCLDPETHEPVALKYLKEKGLDPAAAIKLIVISHWHDDHVKGMADIIKQCKNAKIVMPGALLDEEFIEFAVSFLSATPITGGNGTREITSVLEYLAESGREPEMALDNKVIERFPAEDINSSSDTVIHTLSPSNEQYIQFLTAISENHRQIGEAGKKAIRQKPNHVAIAIWVESNDLNILLGSDLEETGNPKLGWSAILNSSARPRGKADVYKVSHHGSENGDHDEIWTKLLSDAPLCVLTPFVNGAVRLPRKKDVERLVTKTNDIFITSNNLKPKKVKRTGKVQQMIKATAKGGKLKRVDHLYGQITCKRQDGKWEITLANESVHLKELLQK
ncbi:MBL fold metallo-hydrolase [Terasakiella sp. A23]|uniref:MBL fold metallo-hydrolase n=1 Tax=Terasakiella sp. FCG-A23 TaxID=3080561 RepID=UPI002954AA36|nr:MBL fold metallo-hydrolase [Terasakiella sp. A23]MDV7338141.1 MBL fold metallo-hydrolase [Terasakiella sp. A23]